jgi:hypothetical protein
MSLARRILADPAETRPGPVADLERARSVVERRFLHAGEVLGGSAEALGELIAALERLAAEAGGETIQATTAEMGRAADALLGLPERHDARCSRLRELALWGGKLKASSEAMRGNLAYLRVFAINIKITSAPLRDAGEDFAVFAQELADRIEVGRIELDALAAETSALEAQLAGAEVHERALSAQCGRLIPTLPFGLKSGADEMAAHHAKVALVTADVAGIARNIQRKMGAALAALQVGDSTRQRIEHVQSALNAPRACGADPEIQSRLTAKVAGLLRAQLEAAEADFDRDSSALSAGMEDIAGDAAEILKLGDLALGRSGGEQALLERMSNGLAQAGRLVADMEAADCSVMETGQAAAAAAAALGQRVAALQAIRRDVQHMALNAAIKCARIGEAGRPLAVIAVELRMHAQQLEESANCALDTLQGLSAASERLVLEEAGASAGAVLARAAERLKAAGAAAEAEVAAVTGQGETVVSRLRSAVRELDFQGEIGAAMREAAAALAEEAAGRHGPVDAALLAEVSEQITRSYTMAQERRVHALVWAEVEPTTPAAADVLEDALV